MEKNNVEQSQKYAIECQLCGRFVSDNTKEYQTSSKKQPWTQIHRDNRVLHWSFLLLLFVTWRHNPHLLFLSVSEEANADGDLWMLRTVGKILTSIHLSLFTCFVRQLCQNKLWYLILLVYAWQPALLSFCSINIWNDRKKYLLLACKHIIRHVFMHPCGYSFKLAHLCLWLCFRSGAEVSNSLLQCCHHASISVHYLSACRLSQRKT